MKKLSLILIVILLIITQTGCGNEETVTKTEFCLNTACEIKIYGVGSSDGEKILEQCFEEIDRYENMLSKSIEGSDVYRINHSEGEPVQVSQDTINVLRIALEMAEMSGGMFDVTIGELTELWGFTGENPAVPDREDIHRLLGNVDYRSIAIEGTYVTLKNSQASIDLGGVAKGYIADRVSDLLEEKGVTEAIVNLGGNVVAIGKKQDGSPWNIGIERPYSDRTEVIGSVKGEDCTLVTSGIYERNFTENGREYHHILDPSTGFPVDSDVEAVTIMAQKGNSCYSDGLSTVCLIIGKDAGVKLIEEINSRHPEMKLRGAFICKDNTITQTEGMNVDIIEEQ